VTAARDHQLEKEKHPMNRLSRIAAAVAVLAPALALGQTTAWTIDASHSRVGFSVKHLVISDVKGEFSKLSGTAQIDDADLSKSSVEATIDAGSVDTRDAKRDGHLKSPDFFDVAKYPTITFKSTKVVAGKDGALQVTGDLTMRGVTKSVTLDGEISKAITDPWGLTRRGVSLTGKIDRKAWGVSWSKTTDVGAVVGDEVKLDIQAEVVKDQPKK
jgi:polyisoprenoid-binding protein YceI